MTTTVTKRFEIDAAHNLLDHYGLCKHMHGHHYVFEVSVSGEISDATVAPIYTEGMVLDFSYLKQAFNATVGKWDHAYLSPVGSEILTPLMHKADPILLNLLGLTDSSRVICLACNPTAENMATIAADLLVDWLNENCPIARQLQYLEVTVYETPTSCATVRTPVWRPSRSARS